MKHSSLIETTAEVSVAFMGSWVSSLIMILGGPFAVLQALGFIVGTIGSVVYFHSTRRRELI